MTAKGLPPPPEFKTASGLAAISDSSDAHSGNALVAFAPVPGKLAWEGAGRCSIFTEGVLSHLETTDLPLANLMMWVARHVQCKTDGEQDPWTLSSLIAPVYFNAGSLVWFMANIIGFAALLTSILSHSSSSPMTTAPLSSRLVVVVMLATLLLFLVGLQRYYDALRPGHLCRRRRPSGFLS